jgi:DNA primase
MTARTSGLVTLSANWQSGTRDIYILSAQANRRGRIFLDYLRNGRGTTAIGTYSPRVREGFPIAAPRNRTDVPHGSRHSNPCWNCCRLSQASRIFASRFGALPALSRK